MSAVESIVARLDGVQRTNKGWRARCPACGGRGGKVSITEGDDGRALLHCFGGCSSLAVVQAIGLSLADLFPERLRDDSPESRRKTVLAAREAAWGAALEMLAIETHIVHFVACDMREGRVPNSEDAARVAVAVDRISDARSILRGHRFYRPPSMQR